MTLEIVKYVRKPFTVEGVRITNENFDEAAVWCGSKDIRRNTRIPNKSYFEVEVKNPLTERQTQAFVGDWLLKNSSGFKVYTDYAFGHNFEEADDPNWSMQNKVTLEEFEKQLGIKQVPYEDISPEIRQLIDRAVEGLEKDSV